MDNLETRRRRALYRATHRGTKEMDWLLGRYAEARLSAAGEDEVAELERLIALPDPDLQHWILDGGDIGASELAPLIGRIRAFHGITSRKEDA
jgi:antitoxin CptB